MRSAAWAPPLNSDDKAIPTPHRHAMLTLLLNNISGTPSVPGLCISLCHVPAQSPRAWNVPPPHTNRFSRRRSGCSLQLNYFDRIVVCLCLLDDHACSPPLVGNAAPRGGALGFPSRVDLGAVRASPSSAALRRRRACNC